MDSIKIIIYKTIRFCMRIFCVFPIQNNRLLFESYKGKSYSCNPKYICEYLLKNNDGLYEIIWVITSPYQSTLPDGIKVVKKKSFANFYYHMTSKIIISNNVDDIYIPKRRNQTVINTWHAGGAYKKIGLSYAESYSRLTDWQDKIAREETSYYVSSSELFTKYNIREAYRYQGTVIPSGMPRNDLFFDDEKIKSTKRRLRESLGLSSQKILLYAPTFRGDFGNAKDLDFEFSFKRVICALRGKGDEWVILNRSHYSLSSHARADDESVIDVTDYPDMQELLAAADILVTDYSSSMWDFSLTKKPCILYVPDNSQYLSDRGCYTPIESWPGLIVTTEEDLVFQLENLDFELCRKKAEDSLALFGSYESGNATETVCKIIEETCQNESK